MKIVEKILGILAGVGAIFSAIFFILFKEKKAENELINQKYDDMKADLDAEKKASDISKKAKEDAISEMKKNEQKIHDAMDGNQLSNFNALNDILSK